MSIRSALAGLLFATLWLGLLRADDEAPPQTTSATAAAPADDEAEVPAEVTSKSADAAAANSGSANGADFQQTFTEFKQLLAKLRGLQTKFQIADEADRPPILAQYNECLLKAFQIVPVLQTAAVQAYQADPQAREAAEFLMANLADAVESERFADGNRLAEILAAGGYEDKFFPNFAGIAEFCTNDFAAAKVNLLKASEATAIDKMGKEYLPQIDECIRLWEPEAKLRAAEEQADDLPRVRLSTTKGDIVLELFENEAPNTVANFINLVEKHFYDGLKFHRVISGFMAQGGDPAGDGTGGPGYTIDCECTKPNHRNHFAGSLSMANAGPNTGGSQFFMTFAPRPALNGKHTVFGRVVEGAEVLARLQRVDPENPKPTDKPDQIVKAEVLRKRNHEYDPQTKPENKPTK